MQRRKLKLLRCLDFIDSSQCIGLMQSRFHITVVCFKLNSCNLEGNSTTQNCRETRHIWICNVVPILDSSLS